MIALWMLYALAIGLCLGMAAQLLEKPVRLRGKGTRLLWASALVLTAVLPINAALRAVKDSSPKRALIEASSAGPR